MVMKKEKRFFEGFSNEELRKFISNAKAGHVLERHIQSKEFFRELSRFLEASGVGDTFQEMAIEEQKAKDLKTAVDAVCDTCVFVDPANTLYIQIPMNFSGKESELLIKAIELYPCDFFQMLDNWMKHIEEVQGEKDG